MNTETDNLPEEPPLEVKKARFLRQQITTKGGKRRTISVPNDEMRVLHKRLSALIPRTSRLMPSAWGGVPGRSALRCAKAHRYGKHFYVVDIKDAYPSTRADKLTLALLPKLPMRRSLPAMQALLTKACFDNGGLAIGGPLSPLLFNMFVEHVIDAAMRELCADTIVYTRYLDDLIFSSAGPLSRRFRKKVQGIIRGAGYESNNDKTRLLSMKETGVRILGIAVKPGGFLEPTPEFLRELSDLGQKAVRSEKEEYCYQGKTAYLRQFTPFLAPDSYPIALARRFGIRLRQKTGRVAPRASSGESPARYSAQFLEELRLKVPLMDVVYDVVKKVPGQSKWRRSRRTHATCLCPFHNEKTPSFHIYDDDWEPHYHCFGCGAHGDVITFVMQTKGLEFRPAIDSLSSWPT